MDDLFDMALALELEFFFEVVDCFAVLFNKSVQLGNRLLQEFVLIADSFHLFLMSES